MTVLRVENLTLDIPGRRLLDNISLTLGGSSTLAIMGPSGSGKTSLLHCLCGIIRPTSGQVWLKDQELTALNVSNRASARLRHVGFVFQFGELLPELTVLENVALPLKLRGSSWRDAESRALRQIENVGLADRRNDNPDVLSGGEVQRVALARAAVTDPAVILADEPTGALDNENGRLVSEILLSLAATVGAAVIIATHNPAVAARADRVLQLNGGRLCELAPSGALR